MNADVLIGQSYFLRFDSKQWQGMQPYPPLGAMYAASYIRSAGYAVAFFDAMLADSETDWESALDRHRPEVAVLYEDNFNYLTKMCLSRMRAAAMIMIRAARDRGCTVIVAGSDATDNAGLYLEAGAHYVLIGEGELTLRELLDALTRRSDSLPSAIAGLAYQSSESSVETCYTERRPDIRDPDQLPFPAWDLIDVDRYRSIWRTRHGYFSMNLVTTRGCPFHCTWCAKPIWGQRYNARSPENVVAEMRLLQDRYQPDHLWFADDIMGLQPKWLNRFADLLEAENLQIPFKSLHRADLLLRGTTIDDLRRAGAHTVWMGAESGAQSVLDAMKKGTTVEQIRLAAQKLHAAGIQVGFFLQFGYPGEGRQEIDSTLQLVRDCRPDDIGISVSYPLPGTPFHASVQRELGEKRNWSDSSDLAMLYQGPYSTEFYRRLHVIVHREFRARRFRDELRSVIARPNRWRPHHLSGSLKTVARLSLLPIDRHRLNRLARDNEGTVPQSSIPLHVTTVAPAGRTRSASDLGINERDSRAR